MATTVVNTTFKLKRGLADTWERLNPILSAGEPGFVLDTHELKIGDGVNKWDQLPYIGGAAIELKPVDGALVIKDGTIGVVISKEPGNALIKKSDGLYVNATAASNYIIGSGLQVLDNVLSIKLAPNAHGLAAVDGALILGLATPESDGAMSKEDKAFLDSLKDIVTPEEYVTQEELQLVKNSLIQLEQVMTWKEM